ncbi:diaminopimelate epimerase [Scopulibacillus darangshiensis]|uniref:Diaminopimelate epimerase n=1 Tax=Scopulibacillus darangshiensis TaxID=442528 RepID=A0A4R2NYH3_9BACL|nr:diaminopimelate epimerase [Scopulibacillus darangshiensis]TCP26581.1 diaminopimelate epimerase [Scopulibacillus darangshiensis]
MVKNIPFTKMHGLGNCYIYIDLISRPLEMGTYAETAVKVADQNTGIGADGMILILPSNKADVFMRIFNKDGSEAKNCGNGLRCVAKYAFEHNLVKEQKFTIETLGGIVEAEIILAGQHVERVTIDMGAPILERKNIPMAGNPVGRPVIKESVFLEGKGYSVTAVSMGNPHALFFVDNIEEAPIHELGPILADTHPLFPEGVNVGFIEVLTDNTIEYRVWERGSGITQACGTGACAAVVAGILENRLKKDQNITVHLSGGDLDIIWSSDTEHVLMTGAATTICEGTFYL